jgi:hypothetical protein
MAGPWSHERGYPGVIPMHPALAEGSGADADPLGEPVADPAETGYVHAAADRMRRAAMRIRELSEAASPAPWSADPTGTVCADVDLRPDGPRGQALPEGGPMEVAECYRFELPGERAANAELIASLRNIAVPLAAWLDDSASEAEQIGPDRFALALANALLGPEPTPGTDPTRPA